MQPELLSKILDFRNNNGQMQSNNQPVFVNNHQRQQNFLLNMLRQNMPANQMNKNMPQPLNDMSRMLSNQNKANMSNPPSGPTNTKLPQIPTSIANAGTQQSMQDKMKLYALNMMLKSQVPADPTFMAQAQISELFKKAPEMQANNPGWSLMNALSTNKNFFMQQAMASMFAATNLYNTMSKNNWANKPPGT